MDFLKKVSGEGSNNQGQGVGQPTTGATQNQGGIGDKVNSMFGGGVKGEQQEGALDKGIDWTQEHVFGQGQQTNESAVEQMKDKKIADAIRGQYNNMTGK